MRNKTGIILIYLIFLINILTVVLLLFHGKELKILSSNTNDIARQLEVDLNY